MTPNRSYWLQQIAGEAPVAPSLPKGPTATDIAIIGGGYVGLWTAIQIKQLEPGCRVTILEQDICGGGASGRNGGFALSWWPKIASLVKICGPSDGLSVAKDSEQTILDIHKFCLDHNIEAEFRMAPWLWTATSLAQLGAWESVQRQCERLGVSVFENLSPDDVQKRSGSRAHLAGVIDKTAAVLQPARWARGLRQVALKLGVQIFENTPVRAFTRSQPVEVTTPQGKLTCETLIIANNAWAAGIKELSRKIVPITSDMIMTAPANEPIKSLGWTGGECITDSQIMVDYYHVTKEQRIAFGKGGWGIAYGGNLGHDFDQNPQRAKMVEADFRRYYPQLKDVAVTHHWCGPIDRTPNSLPLLGRLAKHYNILYGVGWSGNGVGPSQIGGKVLASLALGRQDRWSQYPLVGRSVGHFPPEPIRFIGAHIVRGAVVRKEAAENRGHKPSWFVNKLAALAPSGLEDK